MNKYLYGVKYGMIGLDKVPENERSKEICLASVKQNSYYLKYVPKEELTEEFYLELITYNPHNISNIPDNELTEKICLEVVEKNPYLLENVLKKIATNNEISKKAICLMAVQNNGYAIDEVPVEELTEEMCVVAVQKNSYLLERVLEKLETRNDINKGKIYLVAVQQDPDLIVKVPSEELTEEICLEAVQKLSYSSAIEKKVLKRLKTNTDINKGKIYLEAVKRYSSLISEVPAEELTEEICLEGVPNLSEVEIKEVLKKLETRNDINKGKIYLEAVKKYSSLISEVPAEELTEEICLEGVPNLSEVAIKEVLKKLETRSDINKGKIYLATVKEYDSLISEVPAEELTEEICLEAMPYLASSGIKEVLKKLEIRNDINKGKIYLVAVKRDSSLISEVPSEELTEEICLGAVKKSPYIGFIKEVLKKIDTKEIKTEAIWLAGVEKNGLLLNEIPTEKRTAEMCLKAVQNNGSALQYIPQEFCTFENVKIAIQHTEPDVSDENVIEFCKMYKPYALANSDKVDELGKAIEELIGNNVEEKKKLEKMIHYIKLNKSYAPRLIQVFYDDDYANPGIRLEQNEFPATLSSFISKAGEFEEAFGEMPDTFLVDNWDNPASEYNEIENNKLLKAGIIEKSTNYREEEHKKWILKMYQIFGYENSLKLLEEMPEISEEMMLELIAQNENAYNEIFEKKYLLTGEIKLSVELIQQINAVGGKKAFEIFKKLNKAIEVGEKSNIKELLIEAGIEEGNVSKIEHGIKTEFDKKKLEKIDEILRNKVNTHVTEQQGRIHDLIVKVIKQELEERGEVAKENLLEEVIKELYSKDENEEYIHSSVIRSQEENIKIAIESFITHNGVEKILNDSILKMLGRTKDKIGQGWIRKLLGIPLEMNENEYKIVCEKLGQEDLEHQEEIKLKGKDAKTKESAMELLTSINCPELITFEKLEVMFGSLRPPFSKAFGKYFLKHKDEIMKNPEMIENFAKMHNAFEKIIKNRNIRSAYNEGRLELKTVLKKALDNKFIYGKEEAELARLAVDAQLEEVYWEDAREIFKTTREREETTIPPTKVVGKKYRGRMLRVDDPLQLFVGDMTGCCQAFGNAGEGAMLHSALEKNGGVFVIEEIDQNGKPVKLVAQSWTWRNDDIMCFDNIEVDGDKISREEQEEVLEIYKSAAEQAIDIDKKTLEKMLKDGEITKEQYEYYTLKEVRIGLGYNQGMSIIDEKIVNGELEKSYDEVKPKEADKRYNVGNRTKSPWIDSKISVIIAKDQQIVRNFPKGNCNEVPVSYRKSRETRELQGQEIDEDVVSIIKQIEGVVYREEQQVMMRCDTVDDIAELYECDVEKIKVSISRDNDWYAMYYDKQDSVYIADIALVNGVNSQNRDKRTTESLISSIELAKKMYEIFIEAADNNKTITCDATKDTSGLNIESMIKNGLVEVIKDEEHEWSSGSEIKMREMALVPNKEKIEKELEKIEELLKKAENRRRVYDKKSTGGIGEGDR